MSDLELITACARSNEDAVWEEFVSRFHKPISLGVVRTATLWNQTSRQLVDDLIQETYLKLCADKCRLLLEFAVSHADAIPAYIKMIAVNVSRDYFKSVNSQKRGAGNASPLLEDVELHAQATGFGQDQMEHEILIEQIGQCLESCAEGPDRERDCLIFWLHYQQGMSAKAIADLPRIGLTAKGVESAIYRLTKLVRERLIASHQPKSGGKEKGFRPAESY